MKSNSILNFFALMLFVLSLGLGGAPEPQSTEIVGPWPANIEPLAKPAKSNEIETTLRTFGISLPSFFGSPLSQVDGKVRFWMHHFTSGEGRESFQMSLQRGLAYKQMIQALLVRHGVPASFYYLPLIESAYDSNAETEKNMVGLWQLASGTGSHYGLDVDGEIDERLDPQRSTLAAVRYLHALYRRFRSWVLVAAAYNAGENRLLRAMREGHTRDFWTLAHRGLLPGETERFVPQFLAAVILGENLERFGFEVSQPDSPGEG